MDTAQQHHQDHASWSSTENKNCALSRSNSPCPPPQYHHDSVSTGLTVDPSLTSVHPYSASDSAAAATGADEPVAFTTPYLSATTTQDHGLLVPSPGYSNTFEESFVTQLKAQGEDFSSLLNSDFNMYPSNSDPSLMYDTKHDAQSPQHQHQQQGQQQQALASNPSINPADLSRVSSPHNHPTPPHHLAPPDSAPSPRAASPVSSPGAFYSPQHSRHASLDPVTAAYMTSQQHHHSDWQGLLGNPAFQGHRRAPSEHSDVSSVTHSPYLPQHESFDPLDGSSHSPLLVPQNDSSSLYETSFGMESFSISDPNQHQAFTPAHSPYISPRLGPQQQHAVDLPADNSFNLSQHVNSQLGPSPGDPYNPPNIESNNNNNNNNSHPPIQSQNSPPGEMGQAAQMAPPSINVELAPPSQTSSYGPPPEIDSDTLSPPRSRGRSKSDPFGHPITRPMTSSSASGMLVSAPSHHDPRSLSPFSARSRNLSTPSSRDTSPARNRRQSTSSIDSRTYILDLADPQRPGASSSDSKRVQKHPATFQCTLCPKRFTRAYNLRSHLRTHTDERPFVCTVCGKAFARQHDRKRHEGLHSGEKKFVCRGELASGGHWGCGRRFARADALGRHFRSEAGRVCIKPLLDEEATERDNRTFVPQQEQVQGHLQPVPQPLTVRTMDGQQQGFTLPAALLAQYPALQALQWDQVANQPPPPDDSNDIGGTTGRTSFDASSGGEYGFGDEDDPGMNNGYMGGHGPGLTPPQPPQEQQHHLLLGVGVNTGDGGAWVQQPTQGWPS
ncbi:hypothetical protein VTO42DRAFT_2734 [Malbranchea cinnamomea]